jgi:hypothetical protein
MREVADAQFIDRIEHASARPGATRPSPRWSHCAVGERRRRVPGPSGLLHLHPDRDRSAAAKQAGERQTDADGGARESGIALPASPAIAVCIR